jgi:hypothetical protein
VQGAVTRRLVALAPRGVEIGEAGDSHVDVTTRRWGHRFEIPARLEQHRLGFAVARERGERGAEQAFRPVEGEGLSRDRERALC